MPRTAKQLARDGQSDRGEGATENNCPTVYGSAEAM